MKKLNHPLMTNNFLLKDIKKVIDHLKKKNVILTQGHNVLKFEEEWSKWLGIKYSVFLNSGSSANLLTMNILKNLFKKKKIIVPALTWSSDISSVIQNNLKPVFVDINLNNLSMDIDQIIKKIDKNTLAVFITHAQGFNGLSNRLLKELKRKKVILIEDVCESHGAKFNGKKLGTFGLISNFSFYYAHHMSTIEGGMLCTNNKQVYEMARMLRSHGMTREIKDKKIEKSIIKKYPRLSSKFIFLHPAYNLRNTEIGAILGRSQLKRLDKNNKIRAKNLKQFLSLLDPNKYETNYDLEGNSNYAFPLLLKNKNIKKRNLFEKYLSNFNIEFRRGNAGGGNQLRQPYLKKFTKNIKNKNFQNVDYVHDYGYYIGNFPTLSANKIKTICSVLNSFKL